VGVCYFWPTMLGVVSERVPRSGALGLGLMGTVGMATVGLITAPQMGRIADTYAEERIPVQQTIELFRTASAELAGAERPDARAAAEASRVIVTAYETSGELPTPETANALRTVISASADPAAANLAGRAAAILGPADNYGGRISFLYVVPLCGVLALLFGYLYLRDRRAGGYAVEEIGAGGGVSGAVSGASGE